MENKSIGVQKSQDLHGGILGTPPRNFEKTELRKIQHPEHRRYYIAKKIPMPLYGSLFGLKQKTSARWRRKEAHNGGETSK